MKTIFIRAVKKLDLNKEKLKELIEVLPKEIHITYSIQYYNLAKHVKDEAEKNGIKAHKFLQIIGCRELKIESLPILHIGSGKFHATNPNLFKVSDNITLFDGYSINKIGADYIKRAEKKRKAKLSKFLSAGSVGVLVSNKYGQQDLKNALKFISDNFNNNHERKAYLFLCNNINIGEFENFPIDFWVNTACPRIEDDSPEIISLDRLRKLQSTIANSKRYTIYN